MNVLSVRDAYSSVSDRYIALFDALDDAQDTAFIGEHLGDVSGPVLDLGCGPGHWSAYLHSLGVDVTGVDLVPEFVAHARTTHPGPRFVLGPMTEPDLPEHAVAGILAWYSTIHLPPSDLDLALAAFRRFLAPGGLLVVGFFDSDDIVAAFDHQVLTAYRWPADVLAEHLARSGFTEVERMRRQVPERPDRIYAAIAARAS